MYEYVPFNCFGSTDGDDLLVGTFAVVVVVVAAATSAVNDVN